MERDFAYGAIPSPPDKRDYKAKEHLNMGILPDKYLPKVYAPVLNQKKVGSCVAHAIATMKWYQEEREKKSNRDFGDHNTANAFSILVIPLMVLLRTVTIHHIFLLEL